MKIKTFVFTLLIVFQGVDSMAQKPFKDKYKTFYDLVSSQSSYAMDASVSIFKQNRKTMDMEFSVRKKENDFFMAMGETERIYNNDMVITMNRGMKSIILGERDKNESSLFTSTEYFVLLDSISDLGNIKLIESTGSISKYEIKIEKHVYKSIELTFQGDLLTKMTVYYSDTKAPYDRAELNMNFSFKEKMDGEYFSINRYAFKGSNGYQLRPEYKDFELSLN